MKRLEWQTPEQAQWQADYMRERARRHRALVDRMETWRHCPQKPCGRQRSCGAEDPGSCLHAVFAAMDDDTRTEFALLVAAMSGGATFEEAQRQVRARIAAADAALGYETSAKDETGGGKAAVS